MIIRHIPMRSIKHSCFAQLVRYLSHTQDEQERVGAIYVTHCHNHDLEWALQEIQAVQAHNQRAQGDKTYHVIMSFPPGEQPETAILTAIEDNICTSLGFGEHQRISVEHHDTDHLHRHIAINKIHPSRYTLHEPYRTYRTLGQLASRLEQQYGLQQTNHTARQSLAENRVADLEHHTGIESLLTWMKKTCLTDMQAAQSWSELHRVLQTYQLTLQERGHGLIISASNGIAVKASSVSRQMSKAKLEQRYGRFEPAEKQPSLTQRRPPDADIVTSEPLPKEGQRSYQPQPLPIPVDTTALYARYQQEQKHHHQIRAAHLARARIEKNSVMTNAQRTARLKRAAIKWLTVPAIDKKRLYALTRQTLANTIQKATQKYHHERQRVYHNHRPSVWLDWLKQQASAGNEAALAALRARRVRPAIIDHAISGDERLTRDLIKEWSPDTITKQGTVIYHVGRCVIRDYGDALAISRDTSSADLTVAVLMAMRQFGTCLTVTGSDEFKAQVVQIAVQLNLELTFSDDTLEHQRQLRLSMAPLDNHRDNKKQSRIKHKRVNKYLLA